MPGRARVRYFSAEYKLKILAEYESLDRQGKGALLRREGLYTALIRRVAQATRHGSAFRRSRKKRGRPEVDPLGSGRTLGCDGRIGGWLRFLRRHNM